MPKNNPKSHKIQNRKKNGKSGIRALMPVNYDIILANKTGLSATRIRQIVALEDVKHKCWPDILSLAEETKQLINENISRTNALKLNDSIYVHKGYSKKHNLV